MLGHNTDAIQIKGTARLQLEPSYTVGFMARTIRWAGGLCCLALVRGSITVYSQEPYAGTHTGTANVASYTGSAAYDPTRLLPPPIPDPRPPMQFSQQLSSVPPPGISIPQCGYFYGFSIEFSVIQQIRGSIS